MQNKVLVNLSNRHVHLSQEDVEILFGKGHTLKNIKDLIQPGQFACDETVTLVGQKGSIENIRVLGPIRKETQVEILQSDVYRLGKIQPPIAESGSLEKSAPIELVGPKGSVKKEKGLIIAMRHVHMDPESASRFECQDRQVVQLKVGSPGREAIFQNVMVRVHAQYALECHIDFDEGNAVGIGNGALGEIIR